TEYSQKLNEYNQFAATYSEPKKQACEADLGVLNQRIADYEDNSNSTLAKKKEELYGPILDKVKNTIKQVGDENKFTAILDGSALLYTGADTVDILPLVKKKLGLQ
ncbi:MAG: OmpH family outer membrane protein, partial [Chitinophagales bacterium]